MCRKYPADEKPRKRGPNGVRRSDPMRSSPPTGPFQAQSLLPRLSGLKRFFGSTSTRSLPEGDLCPTGSSEATWSRPSPSVQPTRVTINYAPDRAVRYDLKGDPIETLAKAIRCGKAYLIVPPNKKDMSVRIGKALIVLWGRYHLTSQSWNL